MFEEALKRCLTERPNLTGVTGGAYNADKYGLQAPRALTRSIGGGYHPQRVGAVWTVGCSRGLPRASGAPASHSPLRAVRGERVGHER